jgi:membrane associated rhomboid family serine protease
LRRWAKFMNAKSKLIIEAICMLFMAPIVGMIVASPAMIVLSQAISFLAGVSSIFASLLYDVDSGAYPEKAERLDNAIYIFCAVCGAIGGWIWGYFHIKNQALKLKSDANGNKEN